MSHAPPTPDAGAIRILLVEDNVDDIHVLRRFVRRARGSYHVDIAYTGADAFDRASTGGYDVVLLDHRLPDVSGVSLMERLRAVAPDLPVVMLTGQGDERVAVDAMKAGAYDYLKKDEFSLEVLQHTLRNVLERSRLQAEVREVNERLRERAVRDGLTGLYNHRHFQERIATEYERAIRYEQPLACIMLDLDHFKSVNDAHGHQVGDAVLQQVSRTLTEVARRVDIIARYGGEEFVVVLPSTHRTGAVHVAQRICDQISAHPVQAEGQVLHITISSGVATTDDARVHGPRDLIKLADGALYEAKRRGRNRVCVAGSSEHLSMVQTPLSIAKLPPERPVDAAARRLFLASLTRLVTVAEGPQSECRGHSTRVARLATRVGESLGLEPAQIETLRTGALLHDIGRMTIGGHIWAKPAPFSAPELERARSHPAIGESVLPDAPAYDTLRAIIRHHHERWDGTGYPDRLERDAIPTLARIVAVCDGYEAMTSNRPWRRAMPPDAAEHALEELSGHAYDPKFVVALIAVVRDDLTRGDRAIGYA